MKEYRPSLKAADCIAVNNIIEDAVMDDDQVLRVQKPPETDTPDINTFAKIPDISFHDGTISVKVFSKLKKDAPAYARGFIGFTFRGNKEDTAFESFYVRPTNGIGCIDPVRYVHTVQYFSCPKYTFAYFRDHGITAYENHAEIEMEQWIALKAVIQGEHADLYVNGVPVLEVKDLKMGSDSRGSIGLYTDNGTDGYFRDLIIEAED